MRADNADSDSGSEEAAEPDSIRVVTTAEGDTLESLALTNGITPEILADANNLDVDADLDAGRLIRVPVFETEGSALPPVWQAQFGVEDASDITPGMMQVALAQAPDAVSSLNTDQILALRDEVIVALPQPFLLRQPTEVRNQLLARLGTIPSASAGRPSGARLGDFAEVVREADEGSAINRTEGENSLSIIVFKEQNANSVTLVNEILERFEEFEDDSDLDEELAFNTVFEQATFIEESLSGVRNEGILGGIFAVIVILIFLAFSVRSTIVVAISIPLSIFSALLLMRMQGLSLNLMTLAGLTIAIGRVVDDTIVVLENIYRHIQRGEPLRYAVYEGTREVATAITAATLVAVAVFLPLGLVGGLTSEFFLPFGLTSSYALLASLLVALTIVPLLASKLLNRDVLPEERETALQRMYTPALEAALDHRLLTLLLAGAFFLVSLSLLRVIDQTFLPSFGEPAVTVETTLPAGTDLDSNDRIARRIEAMLDEREGIDQVETTVGRGGQVFGEFAGGDSARSYFFASLGNLDDDGELEEAEGWLASAFEEDIDTDALAEEVRDELDTLREELAEEGLLDDPDDLTYVVSINSGGGPSGNLFDLQVRSDSAADLRQANDMIIEALEDTEEWEEQGYDEVPIINLTSNLDEALEVVRVEVDPAAAQTKMLSTVQVAFALREILEGQELGTVEIYDEDEDENESLEVYARYDDDLIASADDLEDFEIDGPDGPVRIGDVADIELGSGAVQVTRIDGEPAALITGEISDTDTFGVQDAANKIIDGLELDEEFEDEDSVAVGAGAESRQQREGFADMLVALLISIVIVYLIMVLTFRSLVHPFTILFSLPFAVTGALIALAITGRAISLSSLIGLMMLIGIVTTNAIVLVDLVQQYRAKGMDVRTALVQGGRHRVRPIVMTALATIFALIPQAIGLTDGALIASELATTVIGGLFTSTVLTLIVVPVVYSLLDPLTGDSDNGDGPDALEPWEDGYDPTPIHGPAGGAAAMHSQGDDDHGLHDHSAHSASVRDHDLRPRLSKPARTRSPRSPRPKRRWRCRWRPANGRWIPRWPPRSTSGSTPTRTASKKRPARSDA